MPTMPSRRPLGLSWLWPWLPPLLLVLAAVPAEAQLPPIKIGMTGPIAAESGAKLVAGMRVAFQETNDAGGIMGRNLTLVAMNDAYKPANGLANVNALLDVENVFLLAGVVGSDVMAQLRPLILQRGVPFVGAYSGVPELRSPFYREFVNVRVSTADEMVAHALFLVQYAQVQRIACLYQNDSFGIGGHAALVAALANVGLELVADGAYTRAKNDVEVALEAIATASKKAQAVVLVATSQAVVKFLNLSSTDPRNDPACLYTVVSNGWTNTVVAQVNRSLWGQLYFFNVVPVPGDPNWSIAQKFANSYGYGANNVSGPIAFEGYITGRFISQVLQRTRSANITREMFLEEVYGDRLFVLDDLLLGMYSTNYSGCQQALCSCNSGLRDVFTAQLDPVTGSLNPALNSYRYSVTECSHPVSSVTAPLLFGQLVPRWDNGWRAVALDIGRGIAQAFSEANAAGGAGGRKFILQQQNYSVNATRAMGLLSDRYPLVALMGCVVPTTAGIKAPISSIGNFDIEASVAEDAFLRPEVHLQPATSLELMALAQWTAQQGCGVHLRVSAANANGPALLDMMTKSLNSFQTRPSSKALFSDSNDALASARSGCLIAIGTDADVLAWYAALPAYPALHVLTLSGAAMRVMALTANASNLPQAKQFHFATLITGAWNATLPTLPPTEPWKYGYVLGQAAVQALLHSEYAGRSYTTPAELLAAWYAVKLMTAGTLSFGPYYGDACAAGNTDCACNEGARAVAVRSVASPDVESFYSMATCHVTYTPLRDSGSSVTWLIVGVVVGVLVCVWAGVVVYFRLTRRNNSSAPKDGSKPFCVLFTDIQASTHLWATIPDVMAPALDKHHDLIRRLIAKHQCYEVKTIGDSFMCVTQKPQKAMEFALAVQHVFHDQEWADGGAISAVYGESLLEEPEDPGRVSRACWNGLRVRVGVHYGYGEIKLDPVSKGYDYYGTAVNVAARIESVCHGGQVAVSQAVYDIVGRSLSDVVWSDLGCHPLRGLSEPIHLYQVLPAGPLAQRTFPALRLGHEDHKQKAIDFEYDSEEIEVVTDGPSSKYNSVHPHPSTSGTAENLRWTETHPLVLRGDISAEDLRQHYLVALATLSTLLTTQTTRFKELVAHGLCQRLHVTDFGVEGVALQHTLRGLVHRVLPATVKNVHRALGTRHNSHASLPVGTASETTFVGSFKSGKGSPLQFTSAEGEGY